MPSSSRSSQPSRFARRWLASRATLAGLCAAISLGACAQVPPLDGPAVASPPAPLGPPPPPTGPRPPAPPPGPIGATPAATLDGFVRSFLVSEFGDVDGILAKDGTVVRFPPHMGTALVRTLAPGDAFVAQGEGDRTSGFRAYAIGRRNGAMLVESRPDPGTPPPLPPESRAASMRPMEVSGSVLAILRAPRGELEGVVLTDGSVVRLPRYLDVGQPALAIGSRITARGYGTQNAYGRSLRADAVGVNGQPLVAVLPRGPSAPGRSGPRPGPGRDLTPPPSPDGDVPPPVPRAPG